MFWGIFEEAQVQDALIIGAFHPVTARSFSAMFGNPAFYEHNRVWLQRKTLARQGKLKQTVVYLFPDERELKREKEL